MLLEELRPNLCELPREEAIILFTEYYHKRAEEIQAVLYEVPKTKKKSGKKKASKKKGKQVSVSLAQLETLKKLGLL